jgi:acetyl-CoA decarbonylase/synthase complex subunit delta
VTPAEDPAVGTVLIGASADEGGTRGRSVALGGAAGLPLASPTATGNRPSLALEIVDTVSDEFPAPLGEVYGESLADPGAWARVCEGYAPDLLCLRLRGTHPDLGDRGPEEAAETARQVASGSQLPLVVVGCDQPEKDSLVMPAVCETLAGERCLVGCAVHENFRTFAASATAADHSLIAESPIDLNLAKQLNILLTETGFDTGRIVIHHLTSALGYGLEYTYSIMERTRLAALAGDAYLSQPMAVFVGRESWKVKECTASAKQAPGWGRRDRRGAAWETMSAVAYICAGADLVVLSHPESLARVRRFLDRYWPPESTVDRQ